MIAIALLIAAATLVLATALVAVLSAAEASVRLLSRTRTRRLLEAEVTGAQALDYLADRPSRLAAASAVVRAAAYAFSAGVFSWAALVVLESESAHLWATLGSAVVSLVVLFALGEALPRTLAVQNPERVGLAAAPVASRITAVFAPVARFFAAGWVGITSLVADEPVTDAWLTGDEYGAEAPPEEQEREDAEEAFFEAVVDFASKIVREVMVPRTDMICLEDSAAVPDAVTLIAQSGLSRVPVYHETLDDIIGVLFAKDLLICVGSASCPSAVGSLAREAFFVPETKPVDELLVEMRQRKTHMALVADEYGGTAGLVTIEDLLEEIVGEIFDEYDRDVPLVTELPDGELLLDARLPIDDFNDLLGTAIDLEADSIGGLFVELAGHIPEPGEEIEVEGVRITAQDVEGTRVRSLHVRPRPEADKEDEDAEAHH